MTKRNGTFDVQLDLKQIVLSDNVTTKPKSKADTPTFRMSRLPYHFIHTCKISYISLYFVFFHGKI